MKKRGAQCIISSTDLVWLQLILDQCYFLFIYLFTFFFNQTRKLFNKLVNTQRVGTHWTNIAMCHKGNIVAFPARCIRG